MRAQLWPDCADIGLCGATLGTTARAAGAINTSSKYYGMRVSKSFERLIGDLPAEGRERIEARKRALVEGCEYLRAHRKDPGVPNKPWRRGTRAGTRR